MKRIKCLIACLLILCITLAAFPVTAANAMLSFADVNENSWQYTPVAYVVDCGLMAGKGTDTRGNIIFDPNSPITREEFVQVLYNADGKPTVTLANPYKDVTNTWYTNAVLWAKSVDIANGTPDGSFGIGKNITRQDLAMMLYKYAKLNMLSLYIRADEIGKYADGGLVSAYAKTAMDWAVTNKVLSGKGSAGADISTFRLDPTGTATRAECAAMLKNFMTAFGEILSTCRHRAMEKIEAKEAGCTETGNIAYWHCPNCNLYFGDENGETQIEFADTVLSALGHNWTVATCVAPKTCTRCAVMTGTKLAHEMEKQQTVAPTCSDRGYDLYKCKNCDYTQEKNFTAATGDHTMELFSNTATCTSSGVKTYKCENCSYTTTENVSASGSHAMSAMTVDQAATKCAALGNLALQKYSRMTDVNITICIKCGYVDYESAASIYTPAQETAIFISYTNPIRADFIRNNNINAGLSEEYAQYMIDTYKHVSDTRAINYAKRRAQEIVTDYSHNGKPVNCVENIAYGKHTIYEDFAAWQSSPGHYANMVAWAYPYAGYARCVVGDPQFETITIYSVAVFEYHSRY